ncbi:hypothetical protein FBQ97_06315 [Acidobacteria bacterium ACD]|nr:MAG: hypothetical protein EDX89_10455 [Acidobacteriota bacterium]MCE7958171.1 hypothetical protein [Acidobacteria bacterium ACB2]MDL1949414.1 hypothetical protein [Acidobacteria bacterium ACD]
MSSPPSWLRAGLWVAGILVALYLLDRLLLAAEARGWIYWRRRKASPGTLGSAVASAHALLEPDRRHLVEERRAVRVEEDEEGGPPDTGGTTSGSERSNH